MVRSVESGLVAAWFGRRGSVGCVRVWLVTVRFGMAGEVRSGLVRSGELWQGEAGRGMAGEVSSGKVR